jgi:hypothetical protein
MKSKWREYKDEAIAMRKIGTSMTVIERRLGIPRSTMSGWFKDIKLTETQRTRLMQNSRDGWAKARESAVKSHRKQKALRLLKARSEATKVLERIELSNDILDLALAMLYFGEGAKHNTTALGCSDPKMLRFMLAVFRRNYGITADMLRCDLHLRMDQDGHELKKYWSKQLGLPLERFKNVFYDRRTEGRRTYDDYKGVCLISCGNIAIQRKLIYLYNLFCDKVAELDSGT